MITADLARYYEETQNTRVSYGNHEHRIDDLRENLKIVRQCQPPFDPILNEHHILKERRSRRCCSIHEVDFYRKLEGNISLISQING